MRLENGCLALVVAKPEPKPEPEPKTAVVDASPAADDDETLTLLDAVVAAVDSPPFTPTFPLPPPSPCVYCSKSSKTCCELLRSGSSLALRRKISEATPVPALELVVLVVLVPTMPRRRWRRRRMCERAEAVGSRVVLGGGEVGGSWQRGRPILAVVVAAAALSRV